MLIVADTSALIALAVWQGLSLLAGLFEDVRVPPAVFGECTVPALIPAVNPRLEAMHSGGIHASDALVRAALRIADEV